MPYARIYSPTKTAMQSGKAKTREWILEYNTSDSLFVEPLMGWTGTTTTHHQVCLRFKTVEEALAYAHKNNITATVEAKQGRRVAPKSYADNFRYNRPQG